MISSTLLEQQNMTVTHVVGTAGWKHGGVEEVSREQNNERRPTINGHHVTTTDYNRGDMGSLSAKGKAQSAHETSI